MSIPIGSNNPPPVETPDGKALQSTEVEDMAAKHAIGTQRCYMRSQRGVDAILIGDVKKIMVTMSVDRDGNVSEVGLSEHATDNLGKCLISTIKAWKFRTSPGGTFKFALQFVAG